MQTLQSTKSASEVHVEDCKVLIIIPNIAIWEPPEGACWLLSSVGPMMWITYRAAIVHSTPQGREGIRSFEGLRPFLAVTTRRISDGWGCASSRAAFTPPPGATVACTQYALIFATLREHPIISRALCRSCVLLLQLL